MALSVQSLYNSTLSTYRLKLIAGKSGSFRLVSWMYYTEDASTVEFIRGGELAITTGMNVERYKSNTGDHNPDFITTYLGTLVQKLFELGASGLIVNTGRYITTIPKEIIDLCDRISFPLLTMPWEIHLIDIMQDYGNRIVTEKQKEATLEQTFYNALFYPEKFDIEILKNTSFSNATQYSVILLEMPKDLFNQDDKTIDRYMDYSFNNKAHLVQSDFCWFLHDHKIVYIVHENPIPMANSILKTSRIDKYFNGMKIAISAICRSPKELGDEYAHAELALKFYNKSDEICNYNELGIYKILAEVKDYKILEAMYDEILGKLNIFSEDKRSDYLNTLRLYLETSGKVQKTAQENYTHRNTVNYRIHKITEVLGVDLQNGEVRYKIQTALHIRDLLQRVFKNTDF